MRTGVKRLVAALSAVLAAGAATAEIDGHGPDAWAVTGVAADDVLNMRMEPGTQYLVIDGPAHNARGLRLITCVPLLIPQIYQRLTEAQRTSLPQRWCPMQSADYSKAGWVAQRFLKEDVGAAAVQPGGPGASVPQAQTIGDPLIDGAARLVRDLYADFSAVTGQDGNPFAVSNAQRYFFVDLAPELGSRGSDLLYGAQGFQGTITRIAPDSQTPMLRGMIIVNVDYINFGEAGRAPFDCARIRSNKERQSASSASTTPDGPFHDAPLHPKRSHIFPILAGYSGRSATPPKPLSDDFWRGHPLGRRHGRGRSASPD